MINASTPNVADDTISFGIAKVNSLCMYLISFNRQKFSVLMSANKKKSIDKCLHANPKIHQRKHL